MTTNNEIFETLKPIEDCSQLLSASVQFAPVLIRRPCKRVAWKIFENQICARIFCKIMTIFHAILPSSEIYSLNLSFDDYIGYYPISAIAPLAYPKLQSLLGLLVTIRNGPASLTVKARNLLNP